jgi:long-chain acyl-CoA synthetase
MKAIRLYSKEADHMIRASIELDTLPGLIEKSSKKWGDTVALQWREGDQIRKVTYGEFWFRVESLAKTLLAHGFGTNDHLSIWSENRWEWVVSYFAIQRIGAVVVPLDSMQKPPDIKNILVDADVKVIFASKKFIEGIKDIAKQVPQPLVIVSFDEVGEGETLAEWLKEGIAGQIPNEVSPKLDSLASIIFTSGTTGFSKGVMLIHRNIASNIAGFSQVVDFGTGDVFLSVLPLHHTFECTVGMAAALVTGCTIHFARSLKSRDLMDDFKASGVTVMLGVPLLFEKLLEAIQKGIKSQPWHKRNLLQGMMKGVHFAKGTIGVDLSRWMFRSLRAKVGLGKVRFMISGGAALPPVIAEAYNELGLHLMQGYGLSECSPVLTVNTPGHTKHTSVGKAIPGVSLKIDNPDSEGRGEILAKGDSIMQGYYKNEEATKAVFREGWFATGDSGWIDEEGFLTITGRVKDLIVTHGGKNVNPEEIEFILNQSPYILESLVMGVKGKEKAGEEIWALVVPNQEAIDEYVKSSGMTMTPEKVDKLIRSEVRDRCKVFPDYERIRKVQLHPELFQRTSSGKIKRFLYWEQVISILSD